MSGIVKRLLFLLKILRINIFQTLLKKEVNKQGVDYHH